MLQITKLLFHLFCFFSKNIGATLELNCFMTSVKEHPVWHILEMWSIFEILVWVSSWQIRWRLENDTRWVLRNGQQLAKDNTSPGPKICVSKVLLQWKMRIYLIVSNYGTWRLQGNLYKVAKIFGYFEDTKILCCTEMLHLVKTKVFS